MHHHDHHNEELGTNLNPKCCHKFSENTEKREIEYYAFKDKTGLPGGFIELDEEGHEYYGMVDGDDLQDYKMGEWGTRTLELMVEYFRVRLPTRFDSIKYVHTCYITMMSSNEFQYKTDDNGVHYAYGFSGTGFKFFPLHGKVVYEGILMKNDQKFIPQRFRAKI